MNFIFIKKNNRLIAFTDEKYLVRGSINLIWLAYFPQYMIGIEDIYTIEKNILRK